MAFLIRAAAIDRGFDPPGYLSWPSAMRKKMRFSRLFLLILTFCFFFATPRDLLAEPLQAGEYQVKAAFLLNFARFVEWPASHAKETFTIGILGRDPFDSALDSLSGKTVRGKRVLVRRYEDPEDAREADILFISASEKRALPRILKTIRGNSILTVGDSKDFSRSGVMINLLLLQKRVGFEINLASAQRDGLQISSNLLKLAQEVIE
jgi:hypothetical protein